MSIFVICRKNLKPQGYTTEYQKLLVTRRIRPNLRITWRNFRIFLIAKPNGSTRRVCGLVGVTQMETQDPCQPTNPDEGRPGFVRHADLYVWDGTGLTETMTRATLVNIFAMLS